MSRFPHMSPAEQNFFGTGHPYTPPPPYGNALCLIGQAARWLNVCPPNLVIRARARADIYGGVGLGGGVRIACPKFFFRQPSAGVRSTYEDKAFIDAVY